MNRITTKVFAKRSLTILGAALFLLLTVFALSGSQGEAWSFPLQQEQTATADANWLEPRGLNIVNLVGFVPDTYLQGAIIYYSTGSGIVRYVSGTRVGDTVTITATVYPRYVPSWDFSKFGCLGQIAHYDELGSVAPQSTLRLYDGDRNITDQITGYDYYPAGQNLPIRNSNYWERYSKISISSPSVSNGALQLPANMGCTIRIPGNYRQLTAVYTLRARPAVSVSVVGAETFVFHSYIGVGSAGQLEPLVNQMRARYGDRHDKFSLNVPSEADYFFLNFPPQPVDPYTNNNVDRPTGGTYRIESEGGLSVDHIVAMGLPLYGHWKDSGYVPGAAFLPYYRSPNRLAAPEYFVPEGVDYDPCMTEGNCPNSLLEEIYNTTMTMQIVYLKVQRVSCTLERIPVKMVGPAWQSSASSLSAPKADPFPTGWSESVQRPSIQGGQASSYTFFCYLPLIARDFCLQPPPDDPSGCPCGWFTEDGQMMDFIPAAP
ncbi:MAG TPA: hypothetical protein ENK08_03305 [Chloroflexi bacterium]|nr:hypothetical protein [Chloroflexota bacterium]